MPENNKEIGIVIPEELRKLLIPLAELLPYKDNPKTHPEGQVRDIVRSIREFGFNDPIAVDETTGEIIEGHGRLKAAEKLGMVEVPVMKFRHMTPAQVRAYRIAHNKLTENAHWDQKVLEKELEQLYKEQPKLVDMVGWTDKELNGLLERLRVDGIKEKKKRAFRIDWQYTDELGLELKVGDIVEMGNHRLMCGDATDRSHWEKLIDGTEVGLVYTDPPWDEGIDYQWIDYIGAYLKRGYCFIVADDVQWSKIIRRMSVDLDKFYVCLLKRRLPGPEVYKQHYLVGRFKFGDFRIGERWINQYDGMSTVMTVKFKGELDKEDCRIHNYQKSIESTELFLTHYSREGEIVLDVFGGSGTTMIACEKVDRVAYLMELDPNVCSMIVNRWCRYTGNDEVIVNGEKVKLDITEESTE